MRQNEKNRHKRFARTDIFSSRNYKQRRLGQFANNLHSSFTIKCSHTIAFYKLSILNTDEVFPQFI